LKHHQNPAKRLKPVFSRRIEGIALVHAPNPEIPIALDVVGFDATPADRAERVQHRLLVRPLQLGLADPQREQVAHQHQRRAILGDPLEHAIEGTEIRVAGFDVHIADVGDAPMLAAH
jgi:hypothetical protein